MLRAWCVLFLRLPFWSYGQVETLKKLAPRKALGPFDINASSSLPLDLRDDLNDQLAADNGASTIFSTISRSGFPTTSGPAEDAQAWLPIKGSLAPLDLSLKLLARFTSPDSLHWCVHSLYVSVHGYYTLQ